MLIGASRQGGVEGFSTANAAVTAAADAGGRSAASSPVREPAARNASVAAEL